MFRKTCQYIDVDEILMLNPAPVSNLTCQPSAMAAHTLVPVKVQSGKVQIADAMLNNLGS